MLRKLIPLFVIALCLPAASLAAQGTDGTLAEIHWPPPVYVLRGEVALRGTVNLTGMSVYFIEYRALDEDLTAPASRLYLPAILPATTPVVDDVLGRWDTREIADGLYELRLTVILAGEERQQRTLGPLRVENEGAPPAMAEPTMEPQPVPVVEREEETPVPAETARVTARVNANVRAGDSTSFSAIDVLLNGETAPILGISSRGSGWYQIALLDGRRGWISGSVVFVSGPTDNLPRIVPPPLPILPVATPVPAVADLVVEWINFEPQQPRCNEAFRITAQIANVGQAPSAVSGSINVQDVHISSGAAGSSTIGGFPPLAQGERFQAIMNLTVNTWYEEQHRLNVAVDSTNAVVESNEGNNQMDRVYTLQKADC